MAIKPILFSGPMVRALLEGRKTQTRRVMKPQPANIANCDRDEWQTKSGWCEASEDQFPRLVIEDLPHLLPYAVCDLLWVRETWQQFFKDELPTDRATPVGGRMGIPARPDRKSVVAYRADGEVPPHPEHGEAVWRPSIFMPRWASRLTLRVTEVRVQRLHEISEEDARAEAPVSEYTVGQARADDALSWDNISPDAPDDAPLYIAEFRDDDSDYALSLSARDGFSALWDSLNAKRAGGAFSWASNPWVVAVSFEVIAGNIDQVKESAVS